MSAKTIMAVVTGVVVLGQGHSSLAVPDAANRVCWTESVQNVVKCATTAGGPVLVTISTEPNPMGIAFDEVNQKLYWTTCSGGLTGGIYRANLDGSDEEVVLGGMRCPNGIALDVPGNKMYWTDAEPGSDWIQRANLDGSNIETIYAAQEPHSPVLDLANRLIYWADHAPDAIFRGPMDSPWVAESCAYAGMLNPVGIDLDFGNDKIYWTEHPGHERIRRADNYCAGNEETLVSPPEVTSPIGIELDLVAGKMYWADYDGGRIQRSNLDGTLVEDVVTNLSSPHRLTLVSASVAAVPAVSTWGLVLMTLVGLTMATILLRRVHPRIS